MYNNIREKFYELAKKRRKKEEKIKKQKTGLKETSGDSSKRDRLLPHHIRATDRKGRNATKKRANTT